MKKNLLAVLLAACLLFTLMPAIAGASAEPLEIKLAIDSPTLTVNGATSTIQKPFKLNGTTMVPLSVITKAFGASLKLENNKIITLTYNKTVVVLTIGSSTVKVNNNPVTLTAEPKIVNGITMVPLRVIATAFRATLSLSGNAITINGFKADNGSSATSTGGINSDAGKTKVGDSYFGWSMNYPSDLVLAQQSDEGSNTVWRSVAEDRTIMVNVEDVDQAYSSSELRDYIRNFYGKNEFEVSAERITVGGLSFERTISRTRDGWFFDNRVIQVSNRIYFIGAGIQSSTRDDLNKYQDILGSFKPSFAKSDKSLKDISKVKDGFYAAVDKDYGLFVQLPLDWKRDKDAPNPTFWTEKGFMDFSISSLAAGDTTEAWLTRSRQAMESEFQSDYLRNMNQSTIKLVNGPAQVLSYEYSWDKKTWLKEYQVFLISGKHKYEADFYYTIDGSSNGETLYNQIVSSLVIDTAFVDKNFSELDDADKLAQLTVTKTSKKYGYSITLPQSWYGIKKDFEADEVNYTMPYGNFYISVDPDTTASEYVQDMQAAVMANDDFKKAGASMRTNTTATIGNGLSANKLVIDLDKLTKPATMVIYVIDRNGKMYLINYLINKANDTDANRGNIEKVINSFQFNS